MPHRPRALAVRPIAINAAGVLLILVALVLSLAATQVRDGARLRPGMSTASDVPGTCHRDVDFFETFLAQAELTPAVPCHTPHSVEVLWKVALRGVLARQPDRPTPEMISGQYGKVCDDEARLKRYVGVDAQGYVYFLKVYPRFPSAAEWRAGVRVARCVAQPTAGPGPGVAMVSFGLRNSWRLAASAAIRLCANAAYAYVPCSQPHVEEVLQPVYPFPRSQAAVPSAEQSRRSGQAPCTTQALALLGRKTLPAGLRVVVEPAEPRNWPANRGVGCRIASDRRTGSLREGLL